MSKVIQDNGLFVSIRELIEQSRQQIAISVNATMTALYWKIGGSIKNEVLKNERAEYGQQIVQTLSSQLESEYGKGWSEKQLRHCVQFATVFDDEQIVSTLWRQLSWSHLKLIIYMDDPLKRAFYIEMCKLEKWSVRTFRERIQSMLYERTAISKKPELTIQHDLELLKNEQKLTPDLVFRDPYFLDFLGMSDLYSEKDLLWTGKNEEHVELMQLDKSNIRVADYLTALPSQKVLKEKLHKAVAIAHQRLSAKADQ